MTTHQKEQIKVINQIEQQINQNSLGISTVAPVEDFENDARIALTSAHLPAESLVAPVQIIIKSFKSI